MTLGDICRLPPEKVAQIPEPDRQVVLDEAAADPAFCRAIVRCMETRPDWAHVISASAKEAVENEIDPKKHPGRRGSWPRLRARVRELAREIPQVAREAAAQLTLPQVMQVVRRIAERGAPDRGNSRLGNLGQWDIIGSLVGTLANTASSVYSAVVTANAQKSIAQMQADAAMQGAQAQIAMANAQAAIQAAQSNINPLSSTIGGIPAWAIIVPAVGAAIYFATK